MHRRAGHFGVVEHGGAGRRVGARAQSAVLRRVPGLVLTFPWTSFALAWAREREERRLFLWLPVCAGIGVLLYLSADTEPVFWLPALLFCGSCSAAYALRQQRLSFSVFLMLASIMFGFICGELRTWRVTAPVLDRIRIVQLRGEIEELDQKRIGARFLLHVQTAEDSNGVPLSGEVTPRYVRLSQKKPFALQAGDSVSLKARLLPPAHASIPGGYDFARTAYFSSIGAVGSVLGTVERVSQTASLSFYARFMQSLDRARNTLAQRVDTIIGGDEGAVAAAMVAGKRTLLSENAQELIREAGIFHIITISGVQMTLVAGMIFWITRRLLSLFDTLALRYPIKKISALVAIFGAIFYDMATGSRVGTERALFMTLIVLGSILVDRGALTMRNLGLAAVAVIILEPEAIMGASFQLSFAAVAALIAVHEARYRRPHDDEELKPVPRAAKPSGWGREKVLFYFSKTGHHVGQLLVATLCATSATASFMAGDFHDLSPYVLIGNPLTLVIIEFFAVPGALIGTLLYPVGLDAPVWLYVGLGIKLVFWMARLIASAPGSTLHVHAFAPWALPFLTLGILNMVIWRTWALRLLAMPCVALGLAGAFAGAPFDLAVPPTGDYLAFRGADGKLQIAGKRPGVFGAAQWLSADADGRNVAEAKSASQSCDRFGCGLHLPDGRAVAIVNSPAAFEEDCTKADIIVSSFEAPESCSATYIFDRKHLSAHGAVTLSYQNDALNSERQSHTDRPWSIQPAPRSDASVPPARRAPKSVTHNPYVPEALNDNSGSPPAARQVLPDDDALMEQIESGIADTDL